MSSSAPADGSSKAPPSAVEFEPPVACVRRILKQSLPSSTAVGKDASQAFTRACGIFVLYVTACANDIARENKRQTITANDVLAAIKELDFDEFTPEMQEFLAQYRATEKRKKEAKAAAKAAADSHMQKETPSPKKEPTDAPSPNGAISSMAEHEETEGDDDDKTQDTNEPGDDAESKEQAETAEAETAEAEADVEAEPMEE